MQNPIKIVSDNFTQKKFCLSRFSMSYKNYAFLLILALILILLRTGMVVFDLWSIYEGGDLPEGLLHGNFAFDILDNTWRGWPAYLYKVRGHLGNELLVGIMAMPFYLLFGNSLFVLCQVPIIYSLGILFLIFYICNRWIGTDVAMIASILFVCAPKIIQGWAAYPYGLHLESALFSLLAIALFFGMLESKVERSRILFSAALGVTSGIGIFHCVIHLLTLGCILTFWLLKDKSFYKSSKFLVFLMYMAIGLIPYFYLGSDSLVVFIKELIGGGFARSYTHGRQTHNYITTLTLMSILFWPVGNLFLSQISGLMVTLIGGTGILGCGLALRKLFWKDNLVFTLLVLYCAIYLSITFITQVAVQYYFFPIYAHMTIILATCFCKVQTRYLNQKRYYKGILYFALLCICIVNVYEIVKHFEPRSFAPQLKKQLAIKGCCFYWPDGYYVPSGLKTDITLEVDQFALRTIFNEMPMDNDLPRKTVFVSKIRNGIFPLTSPKSYLVFGEDVSYAGLTRLADEIESRVPDNSKEYAYKGLAVYYANDNWLADLLDDFKAGIIKDKIPPSYQHYFYGELTRKILNKYKNNPNKFKETIDMFNGREKEWMLKTKVTYNAFIDDRRIVYQKIVANP